MSNAETAARRAGSVVLSALCLLAATNGPAVTLSLRVLERPFSFEDWPFDVPIHLVGAIGIWRLAGRWRTREAGWSLGLIAVGAFGAWMLVSNLAGDATAESDRRLLITLGVVIFGLAFAYERLQHQMMAIALATNAATLASAVLILAKPKFGKSIIDEFGRGDYFQGIFANRNSLGAVCAVAVVSTCAVAWIHRTRLVTAVAAVLVVIDLWLLVGSRSATPTLGLAAAAAALAGAIVWQRVHPRAPRLVLAGYAVALAAIVALTPLVLDLIGRNGGLSDRRGIWSDVIEVTGDRPLIGYGFWSFWENPDLAWPVYVRHGGVQFGSAHNSLLEVALGNGWIAGVLFLAVIAAGVVSVCRLIDRGGPDGIVWGALLALVLVEHSTESFVLYHSYMLVPVVAAACLARRGDRST